MSGIPIVRIEGLTKRFGEFAAVDAVSLEIPRNAFFALLGPSGCGKTTLLRMLAGFEQPSEGRILIDGEEMAGVPPNRRPVNMVFQSYAVFPHMTVAENVAYGLKVTGVPRPEIERRVGEALRMVRLSGFERRRPDQLSGGQKQRVALARALVKRPKLLLLDEPLSALDRKLREEMQLELVRLQHEVGITFVIVTHDQGEALSMATHVAVMNQGRVLQISDPRTLYEQPRSRFVADFIGQVNVFEARRVAAGDGELRLAVDGIGELALPDERPPEKVVAVAVRPEKMRVSAVPPEEGRVTIAGRVGQIAYFGDHSRVFVEARGRRLVCIRHNRSRREEPSFREGDPCYLSFRPEDAILLSS